MRKHKRISLDCFGSQRLCKILTLLGGGEAPLCLYLYDWSGSSGFLIISIVGFLLLAAGLALSVYAAVRRCTSSPGFPGISPNTARAAEMR